MARGDERATTAGRRNGTACSCRRAVSGRRYGIVAPRDRGPRLPVGVRLDSGRGGAAAGRGPGPVVRGRRLGAWPVPRRADPGARGHRDRGPGRALPRGAPPLPRLRLRRGGQRPDLGGRRAGRAGRCVPDDGGQSALTGDHRAMRHQAAHLRHRPRNAEEQRGAAGAGEPRYPDAALAARRRPARDDARLPLAERTTHGTTKSTCPRRLFSQGRRFACQGQILQRKFALWTRLCCRSGQKACVVDGPWFLIPPQHL